ncbi:hypothetical protein JXA32_00510 [Candidatus Sumerlaeota bacterium]|nr:hypothetical protein [Candidatus Sumerlaeota bacterium]
MNVTQGQRWPKTLSTALVIIAVAIRASISFAQEAGVNEFMFEGKIHNPDMDWPTKHLGESVSADSDTMIVGAPYTNLNGQNYAGFAQVYRADGLGGWTLEAELNIYDAETADYFGCSVCVSGDTAVIGAYQDEEGELNSGAAYIFIRSGDVWTQQSKHTAGDPSLDDFFGFSVAVSNDVFLVGSHYHDDPESNAGSVYVFKRMPDLTKTHIPWGVLK